MTVGSLCVHFGAKSSWGNYTELGVETFSFLRSIAQVPSHLQNPSAGAFVVLLKICKYTSPPSDGAFVLTYKLKTQLSAR